MSNGTQVQYCVVTERNGTGGWVFLFDGLLHGCFCIGCNVSNPMYPSTILCSYSTPWLYWGLGFCLMVCHMAVSVLGAMCPMYLASTILCSYVTWLYWGLGFCLIAYYFQIQIQCPIPAITLSRP